MKITIELLNCLVWMINAMILYFLNLAWFKNGFYFSILLFSVMFGVAVLWAILNELTIMNENLNRRTK